MSNANGSYQSFRKFSIVLGLGLGLWNAYLTFAWLVSSHPWGAIYPALFSGFFLWTAYNAWESKPPHLRLDGWALEIFGALAGLGIAALWVVAERTNDDVYHDQAVDISFWGGLLALGGLFMGAMWIHPRSRARMLAVKRGEFPPGGSVSER